MLKLVHDATAEVANDPQDLAVGLDELCRLAALGHVEGGVAGRAARLSRRPR